MREGWFNYMLFGMKTEEGQCPFVAVGAQRPGVPHWYGRIGEAGNVTAFHIDEGIPHCIPHWRGRSALVKLTTSLRLDSFVLVEAPRLVRGLCSVKFPGP